MKDILQRPHSLIIDEDHLLYESVHIILFLISKTAK